jgi:hypothetical protein
VQVSKLGQYQLRRSEFSDRLALRLFYGAAKFEPSLDRGIQVLAQLIQDGLPQARL